MARTPSDIIARTFGEAFATALDAAPVNEWTGPIRSSFGIHYVRVTARTPAVMPQLPDVRDQVMREWENERRLRARDDMYARLRAGYDVAVEARPHTP
jgi:parvulin-like peptidyl-prolyl isomerase